MDAVAVAAAIGQGLLSGWVILMADPAPVWLMLFINMAVVAIGGAVGIWTSNLPLALFGTVVLLLFGFSQGAILGPPILLLASLLGIGTYLEWRRVRSVPG